MSDDDIRGYERALQRAGRDPREVGAALLGTTLGRWWLLTDEQKPNAP